MENDYVIINEYGSLVKVKVTKEGLLICPLCGAKFFSAKDLVSHIISHFSSEQKLRQIK